MLSVPETTDVLEAIGGAALLLDQGRRVLGSNERGTRLLQDAKLLAIDRSGRLKLARPADNEVLEGGWARIGDGKRSAAALLLRLGVLRSASSYLARLVPLRGARFHVLLVLHQLGHANVEPAAIQAAFALSAAEARLGGALVARQTLAEYALQNGLSRNTARNQLSAIFMKTGTRRQTDFVAMVVAALGPGWSR